ncbi:MAG TPA: FHA domain-containing protein, partial [Azospira sp.]|nr:FHA domain-containing protein [Azospira sp.]
TAARMAGLAKAGQIITNAQSLGTVSPLLLQSTRDVDRLPVKGKAEEMQIVEVLWQETEELTMKAPSLDPTMPQPNVVRLCVRHRGKAYLLDDKTASLTLGRGTESDILIEDRKASRSHAKIERRRDKYVLIDQSTNGTFVAVEGEAEVFLRREEVPLRNKGLIAFGHSAASGGDNLEVVQFEYL